MGEYIGSLLVGLLIMCVGFSHMKGNISLLHSYHRKRVNKKDEFALGKWVGIGCILIGLSIVFASVLSLIYIYTQNAIFEMLSNVILGIGMVVGIGTCLYTIIKYNKGLF